MTTEEIALASEKDEGLAWLVHALMRSATESRSDAELFANLETVQALLAAREGRDELIEAVGAFISAHPAYAEFNAERERRFEAVLPPELLALRQRLASDSLSDEERAAAQKEAADWFARWSESRGYGTIVDPLKAKR
ncbi:MAG: hypothetical protein JNM17_14145 [Archangium sp.]|nr:hypothetical protein [Archangium sp.]